MRVVYLIEELHLYVIDLLLGLHHNALHQKIPKSRLKVIDALQGAGGSGA